MDSSTPATPSYTSRASWLQLLFPLVIILIAAWLTIGRAVLGSMGWGTVFMMITVVPVLVVYAIVVGIVIFVRYKRSGYLFSYWMKSAIYALLISSFVLGLTLIDGGDTPESVGSVLTNAFNVQYTSENTSLIWVIDGIIATIAGYAGTILLVAIFVLSIIDRQSWSPAPKAAPPTQDGSL